MSTIINFHFLHEVLNEDFQHLNQLILEAAPFNTAIQTKKDAMLMKTISAYAELIPDEEKELHQILFGENEILKQLLAKAVNFETQETTDANLCSSSLLLGPGGIQQKENEERFRQMLERLNKYWEGRVKLSMQKGNEGQICFHLQPL